jgi:uncharacterized protein YjbJ (UPF0337 family)
MEHNKAGRAREGLIDSIKGKAKEVIGAVTGNDSLTAEGQLQQTEARQRKDADAAEAIADAESAEAHTEAAQAKVEGAQARVEVNARAAATEDAIRKDAVAHKQAADQNARQEIAKESDRADVEAQRKTEQADAHARVDRLRAEADDLTDDADLP